MIDAFATRKAAGLDPTADNTLGNVIAANSISVFLGNNWPRTAHLVGPLSNLTIAPGLGLPWLVAAIYWEIKMPEVGFIVKAGGLEFTTSLYLVISVLGT